MYIVVHVHVYIFVDSKLKLDNVRVMSIEDIYINILCAIVILCNGEAKVRVVYAFHL